MEIPQLPSTLNSRFSPDSLKAGAEIHQKSQVQNTIFFRSGYTCDILLEGKGAFTPIIAFGSSGKLDYYFCSCTAHIEKNNLCSHLAALVFFILSQNSPSASPELLSSGFESSAWFLIGNSFYEASKSKKITHILENKSKIKTEYSDGKSKLQFSWQPKKIPGELNFLLSAYPSEEVKIRPTPKNPFIKKEKLLKKITSTKEEVQFNHSGYKTVRQAWEDSFWYKWSKSCFMLFGDEENRFLVSHDQKGFCFRLLDEEKGCIVSIYPPGSAIEKIIREGKKELFINHGYTFHEECAELSFKIEFNAKHALIFSPVIILSGEKGSDYFTKEELGKDHFGKYFFLEKTGGFYSLKPSGPFFADAEASSQASLFGPSEEYTPSSFGIPTDKETILPQSEIMGFIKRHRDEILRMRPDLVPPSIRQGKIKALEQDATLHFEAEVDDWLHLSVNYKFQNKNISLWDIWLARKDGKDFVISGDYWIKVSDDDFGWVDYLSEASFKGRKGKKSLKLSKLEYLKLRSAMPGKMDYEGNENSEKAARMLETFKPGSPAPNKKQIGMELYHYQETGLEWLWFLYQNSFGGLLCDDMGLGKTHQAMALIRSAFIQEKKKEKTFLVVSPTSVLTHWQDKMEEYLPGLKTGIYHGQGRVLDLKNFNVIITSYTTLRNDIDLFKKHFFHIFILDEMQTIKNRSTSTYQALSSINKNFALGLTGTPIENSVSDIKNLLDFVLPGYLPPQKEFELRYVNPIELRNDSEAKERLHRMVQPFVLRRTKAQVLQDLPEKIEDKRYCLLTEDQVKLYKDVLKMKVPDLLEKLDGKGNVPYIHIFAALNYLKQICNHPAMLSGNNQDLESYSSGKWDLFCEILDECLNSGLKVVVFSQYVKMLKLMETYLRQRKIGYSAIVGATVKRKEALKRFREDPDSKVFLASLRAAGLGIDLTAASVVIHYDRWWNQAREDQATDRVHRKGQTKGVQVMKLITRGTLEEKIDKLIQKKQGISESLVKEDDPTLSKQFTRDELKSLLSF